MVSSKCRRVNTAFFIFRQIADDYPSAPHRLQTRTPFNARHLWLPPHRVDHP
jgi:hypothetical protein